MRITKKTLKRIIREEARRLAEDSISDELDNLRKNVDDDKEHIDNLEKDIEDDREEMKDAHEAEKNESRRRRGRLSRTQLRRMVREAIEEADEEALDEADEELEETHGGYHQGYDAREDESLGMRRGAEAGYEQGETARRDDSYGAWGQRGRRHESRNRRALKRKLARTIKETLRRRR
tara:strand:- start:189 stop:722 length:534 start_codon:yes stop_codon:yes gene_type:complete